MAPEEDVVGDEEEETPELDTEAEEGTEAEGEGEEGESEDEAEGSEETAAAGDEGKVSRRTARVQKLEKERDDYREKYEKLLTDARNQPAQPVLPREDPAVEQAKIAAMEPVDRVAYLADKRIQALEAQLGNLGFQTQDSSDKASYDARCAFDPLYEKYKPRVETALASMRANRANSTREAILTYLIGEDARKRAAEKPDGQRRRAAAASRVEKANGKSANMRSDASTSKAEKSLEDRLRGKQI